MSKKTTDSAADEKKCAIGGQALIEGIMMRGAAYTATVVRKNDGTFAEKVEKTVRPKDRCAFLGWPVIRGVANMIDSLITGVREITYSASFFEEEEPQDDQKEALSEKEQQKKEKKERRSQTLVMVFAVILSLILSVGLFFFLPTFLVSLYPGQMPSVLRSLIEGAVRITVLILYIFLISRTKDIKRVFMYHGAEHKTIFTYEQDAELTVENVRTRSRFHPRCGTNFLFIVMIVSVLIFAFVKWEDVLMRFVMRIVLIPVVVGVSYELIMLSGKYDNWLTRLLCAPGLWLQRLTTREPDDAMIETAIRATRLALGWDGPQEKAGKEQVPQEGQTSCGPDGIKSDPAGRTEGVRKEPDDPARPDPSGRPE